MNIHLALDDKFIDYFINRQVVNFPNSVNRYIICTNQKIFKHVKSTNVEICPIGSEKDLLNVLTKYNIERVFVHFFSPYFYKVISELPSQIKVYWMFWGGDGFCHPSIYPDFLDNYSLLFYRSHNYDGKKNKIFNRGFRLKSTYQKYIDFRKRSKLAIKAFRRVDFFCHYLLDDYNLLKKKFKLKAKYLDFCYCSYDDLCTDEVSYEPKINCMIGNSANEANNHISFFEALKKSNLSFDKVYCPLSYAGDPAYIKNVILMGKKNFGDKFIPLTDFMDLASYYAILKTCKYFFHNHFRSQAYGNIVYQIHLGGTVFMNYRSPLRKFLTKNGVNLGMIKGMYISCPNSKNFNKQNLKLLLSEVELNKKYSKILL